MDIQLKKKPWYVRYRLYLAGGVLLLAGLIYVIILASGPQRLRIDADSVQLAEVKQAPFREYVDVEGVVHPILTLMVNARESGNVERIVAEEGSLLQQGDTILVLTNPNLLREIDDQRDEWEKQRISYQEKSLEMEQKKSDSETTDTGGCLRVEQDTEKLCTGAGRIPHGHPQQGAAGSVGR